MTYGLRRPLRWDIAIVTLVALLLVISLSSRGDAYERPGKYDLVSVNSRGEFANGTSDGYGGGPEISADGRYVAFDSMASNLDPRGDENNGPDVFVRDRKTGRTTMVSVTSTGEQAKSPRPNPLMPTSYRMADIAISASGRYVAFASDGRDFTPEVDANMGFDVFVHDRRTGRTELMSIAVRPDDGVQLDRTGTLQSGLHTISISANGRFVAFDSLAPDLVKGGPTCEESPIDDVPIVQTLNRCLTSQVYIRDRKTRTTKLVSVSSSGEPANGESFDAVLAPSGRRLAFVSSSTNLDKDFKDKLEEYCNAQPLQPLVTIPSIRAGSCPQVYLRDLRKGKTELISRATGHEPSNYPVGLTGGAVSADERYITFSAGAGVVGTPPPNLVPNPGIALDTPPSHGSGRYVYDRVSKRIEKVNVTSTGSTPYAPGGYVSLSADGRFAGFTSYVLPNQQNIPESERQPWGPGLWVHDRRTGATETLLNGLGHVAKHPGFGLSSNGRSVALSTWWKLVDAVENADPHHWHVYVRDRGVPLGAQGLVADGRLDVSGDRGFGHTGTLSQMGDAGDVQRAFTKLGGDLLGARIVYRAQHGDLFSVLELEHMPSIYVAAGTSPFVHGLRLKAGGNDYEVRASLVGTVPDFGLFSCEGAICTKIADLRGGYGTTGERIVVSLPLSKLGLDRGGDISDVEAFTALRDLTGLSGVVDTVALAGSSQ